METVEKLLFIYDTLTSPTAQEVYAGALALVALAIVAELILGMF